MEHRIKIKNPMDRFETIHPHFYKKKKIKKQKQKKKQSIFGTEEAVNKSQKRGFYFLLRNETTKKTNLFFGPYLVLFRSQKGPDPLLRNRLLI